MRPCAMLAVLALAVAGGCAKSTAGTGSEIHSTTVGTPRGDITMVTTAEAALPAVEIAAPLDRAWRAVAGAYEQIGLALTVADTTTHTLGAQNKSVRRTLNGERLSLYLECGTTAFS